MQATLISAPVRTGSQGTERSGDQFSLKWLMSGEGCIGVQASSPKPQALFSSSRPQAMVCELSQNIMSQLYVFLDAPRPHYQWHTVEEGLRRGNGPAHQGEAHRLEMRDREAAASS